MKRLVAATWFVLFPVVALASVYRFAHTVPGAAPPFSPPQFILADTAAELPTSNVREGDMAYAKDDDNVYKRTAGAWVAIGGGTTPTGTGFRHVTAGVEDGAAKLVDTADVNNSQITYAKIQNVTDARLLGRSAGSSGVVQEITVGAGLTLAAGSLTASGAAPAWGAITGTLSDQTDLQTALDGKEPAGNFSGIGACGANSWASTLNDTAAPTCTQPAFTNISGTALYTQGGTGQTTAPDDNVLVGSGTGWALKALTTCVGTAKAVTYDASTNTWGCNTITAAGVVNVVETSVAITSLGSYFTATVTGQSWVTASSVIVCAVLGTDADGLTAETIAVATPRATVANRVVGTGYDLLIANPYGLEGTVRVQCTGA